ncbi:pyrophosphate--fructose 6-phosphate 1-phosphotransferase subunit beta [Tribonema minus]|uniref:Pyrophosphate--fructose 6-phosphate 1-phosphotransferase n=1 Tax=Tribonema minus TaxID=303371 RepID=A0A835YX68_9STRA|nr:pyrophosphate--fructose 6-phosphate 1-phosphotransferase subunit beta [Tribonema minus]
MSVLNPTTTELRGAYSKLQLERKASKCIKPNCVTSSLGLRLVEKEALGAKDHHERVQALFPKTYGLPRVELEIGTEADVVNAPLRIGVVLSGGQAPGGHNVIAGVFDYAMRCSPDSKVFGFLNGPHGVMNGIFCEIDTEIMAHYRNTGGFDMLGSGRDKIESEAQMASSMAVATEMRLDGLIVIGGDDSNTNAAILAEYFAANGCTTRVCGCPKTIDGDLKNEYIPISFGFDTAAKTFSEEIGNVALDTLASQKYYHFIRLMGRAASNIALECALQTRPNVCLISEEVEAKGMNLLQITNDIADMVVARAAAGKHYGVCMLPEGLIEFIPEFNRLIAEINNVLASGVEPSIDAMTAALTPANRAVFAFLPKTIKLQLLLDRDPHGNVQVAMIETERMLAETVAAELERRRGAGLYMGKFAPQFHSFGYEGRCALPSHFDCSYSYTLGYTAAALVAKGLTALMASIQNVQAPIEEWTIGGVPITMMCHMEQRHGKDKPVIKKALVDLEGAPFKAFAKHRAKWGLTDMYRAPGPIQFYSAGARDTNFTLMYELLGDGADEAAQLDPPCGAAQEPAAMGSAGMLFRPIAASMRSKVERSRQEYVPKMPASLEARTATKVSFVEDEPTQCLHPRDASVIKTMFPHTYGKCLLKVPAADAAAAPAAPKALRVGIVLCGRQAAGGHNVIWGVHEFLKGTGSTVLGFVGGLQGLRDQQTVEITDELVNDYRNQGGFDLLGRTVDSIKNDVELAQSKAACEALKLDGLVLVGGNRTHTDAAYLTEHFVASGTATSVVAVPCSISGGARNQFVETAVGFDTAVKVYSQLAGNTAIDGASARKYWYFMRLMGQGPSHIALEVALQTHPNVVLLAEEVAAKRLSLQDIVHEIADAVQQRAATDRNFGTVLIPEGLIKAIPEIGALLTEIDTVYAESGEAVLTLAQVQERLTRWGSALLQSLPLFIQQQVCLERQSNNRAQLSQIETEKMLVYFVDEELRRRKAAGVFKGKFSAVCSYLGYQARSAMPSNFDCDYAFSLGGLAASLVHSGATGYLATLTGLKGDASTWQAGGVPFTSMLVDDNMELSLPTGQARPRIPPTQVDLNGAALRELRAKLKECQLMDKYRNPGPVQFAGDTAESRLMSVELEGCDYLAQLAELRAALARVEEACRPGCSATLIKISTKTLQNLRDIMLLQEQK